MIRAVTALVGRLADQTTPSTFNPWRDSCSLLDLEPRESAAQRSLRLIQHLTCPDARLILVGEAPGYQGCRYSGIPFVSERLLMEGAIPRVQRTGRITRRRLPFSEPSATIVWSALDTLGLKDHTILWNTFPFHPYYEHASLTNRKPYPREVKMGVEPLEALIAIHSGARVVPIGRVAEELLRSMGIHCENYVRHPANGGARLFREGLERIVSNV